MVVKQLGKIAGFVGMLFIFSIIFYSLLYFLHKLPPGWSIFHILFLVLLINLIGFLLNHFLK